MNRRTDLDFGLLIQRGEVIDGQSVPIHSYNRRDRYKEKNGAQYNYDKKRAQICLNCPLPSCDGDVRCYNRMKKDKALTIQEYTERSPNEARTADSLYFRTGFGDTVESFLNVLNGMMTRIEKI